MNGDDGITHQNNRRTSRKRKTNPTSDTTANFSSGDDNDDVLLTLGRSLPDPRSSPPQVPPSYILNSMDVPQQLILPTPPPPRRQPPPSPRGPTRVRRNPTQSPRDPTKPEHIPQPYPWATTKRATTHTLNYLESQEIKTITGAVQCRKCDKQYELELNLHDKFMEIASYMAKHKAEMHDRAPPHLMNPTLLTCTFCNQENSVRPLISGKKKTINWLFLLLGQMLGCCTLDQLKYFCKHTKNHRTGAKDRVLYLAYLTICKQLDPAGPFDR